MVDLDRVIAICVWMGVGAFLVVASHLMTMRAVEAEIEAWRTVATDLTSTTEECVALLPTAWTTRGAVELRGER